MALGSITFVTGPLLQNQQRRHAAYLHHDVTVQMELLAGGNDGLRENNRFPTYRLERMLHYPGILFTMPSGRGGKSKRTRA